MDPHGRLLLMAVHAHPDDETISMGGTLATYAAAHSSSTDTYVVTGTRGELGEIVIPERDTPEEHATLGETRMGEIAAAMAALGVTHFENLGFRDSGMVGDAGNDDPRSYHQHSTTDLDGTVERLVRIIRTVHPDVLATYDEFGGYGHPDHIAAARVTRRAWEVAGDPTWRPEAGSAWSPKKLYEVRTPDSQRDKVLKLLESRGIDSWWSEPKDATPEDLEKWRAWRAAMACPDALITTRIDISTKLAAKRRAIQAHATQIKHDSPLLLLSDQDMLDLGAMEQYRLIAHRLDHEPAQPESDLFAGLR
ncbi:MAG: N-acetyl-1-D-myo-inositol-2-amino-2-deoxy-alpha-D-glucopyranoside deacetylase [Chloroflexi bacterium]|nr:MAG: N-acetyl-1-D-myo-inositol-2-amino-2-deoxy-alpha-D-glucopyranoside deacetylase [Chloroflexota bacterium]RLT28747.1 MAG: N-acetyl-1-D-myo-inositol-2-amino-2-deoxy-alpha-D-glucopyranoside deacetylase [Chloroflexota bacterium]